MTAAALVHRVLVRASQTECWSAITDPDAAFLGGWVIDSTFRTHEKWRLVRVDDDTDAVEGDVEVVDPPHRLVATWRFLDLADEPDGRVTWTLEPVTEELTLVSVRHDDLALSPRSWERAGPWWVVGVSSLKTYLETGSALSPTPLPVVEDDDVEAHWHRAQAITANNSVWEFLVDRPLLPSEVDEVLERAYAAAYHWRRARGATAVNLARAAYLVARAHAVCGQGEAALHHAERCSDLVAAAPDDMADFDHAYAYEARARALAALGRVPEAVEMRRRAATVLIADDQDRAIFDADLAAGPWFGVGPG
jgi:uncharacterized protein YndB with AHSA1/START domain